MTTARIENPALYTAYQQFLSGQTTAQQSMTRARTMEKMTDSDKEELQESVQEGGKKKKKPRQQVTHEDAVAGEVSKGFDRVTAEQRVLHSHGRTLPRRNDAMSKAADTVICKFMRRCDQIMMEKRCDRVTAMRTARQEDEDLFGAFQIV